MAKKSTSSGSKGRSKIQKVMKEHKEGKLKSGSGKTVKSRKQAVAIALSEARKSGAKIPKKERSPSVPVQPGRVKSRSDLCLT